MKTSTHWPHRALKQAAPLRRLPGNVTDLERFRLSDGAALTA
jgi:hypothetical protein